MQGELGSLTTQLVFLPFSRSASGKARTDFPASGKAIPLSEVHLQPSYEWALLPYLHQVHAHEPQEVPWRQLPEVLAQGDATLLPPRCSQAALSSHRLWGRGESRTA